MNDPLFLWQAVAAGFATLGTSILANAPRRTLAFAMLTGMMAQGASLLMIERRFPEIVGAFTGGLLVGLMADLGARRYRTPTTIFTIPGFISLVPGSLAFRAVEQFLQEHLIQGLGLGLETLLRGGAIAAGVAVMVAIRQALRNR